ncbi:hypothetical protein [Nitrogeniibacter aestuarii]|uniref:hypothetical protein n=1 Tax=Nitrogeniibacter aestuarii TaxID=2815343 RepID=UPI001D11039A|nr:hypothetical protein [Nitrogeniibacter aestuarii]
MDYLQELLAMVQQLISGVNVVVTEANQQATDGFMVSERWGVRNTTINWSTHVCPSLERFANPTPERPARRPAGGSPG